MVDRPSASPGLRELNPSAHRDIDRRGPRRRLRTALWLTGLVAAFVATHLPPAQTPRPPLVSDTWLHLSGYAVLGALTVWRLTADAPPPDALRLFRWYLILCGYAVFDETTQPLVGRSLEASDLAANLAGAVVGMVTMYGVTRRRSRPAVEGGPARP